ncbi:MAG: hypothetical protein QXY49_04410, partial [Thermofilaceae archaeon]
MGMTSFSDTGVTRRTLILIALLMALLVPSNLYITLVGGAFGVLQTYTLVLLFVYISRYLGADLTKREVYALFYALSYSTIYFNAYPLLYRAYLRVSEITNSFIIGGEPVSSLLPAWFAPPAGSPVFKIRTLFHPDMLYPLAVSLVFTALWLVAELSMIMLSSFLFVEVEALPYPLAQVDSTYITMISDRPSEWLRGFLPSVILTLFLATLIYLPSIGAIVGLPAPPIGFYDFSQQIADYLPGAALGIYFYPWVFLWGFMIPFNVAATALVTSVIIWVFLNSLFITTPLLRAIFPDWAKEYEKGMSHWLIVERSTLRIWAPIQLGAQLALALTLVVRYRREIARALIALAKGGTATARGYPSLKVLLGAFFLTTGLIVLLYDMLLPGLPIYYIALIGIGLGLLIPLTNAYMTGTTGSGFGTPPYTWQFIVYSQIGKIPPSTQVASILYSMPTIGSMAGSGAHAIKVAHLVGVKPTDLIKVIVIAFSIGTIANLFVVDALWRLAPIPSMAYPETVRIRDTTVYDCIVASGLLPLKPDIILPALGLFLVIFATLETLNVFLRLPVPISGVALGLSYQPATTIVLFLSSLTSYVIIPKLLGRER